MFLIFPISFGYAVLRHRLFDVSVIVRMGEHYDVGTYADLYGNKASFNWGNRHCAKGYTFHRIVYGPYRLKYPIVRRGWKS